MFASIEGWQLFSGFNLYPTEKPEILVHTTPDGKTCRNWANKKDEKSCRMFLLYENLYVCVVKIISNGL